MAWYSGDIFEKYMMTNRMFGPYGWVFWALMLFNVLIPQLLWFATVRTNVLVAVCSWSHLGQYRHVAGALCHRRHQPASRFRAVDRGACTHPTFWDWADLLGTIGLFLTPAVPVHPLPADDLDF